MEIKIDENWLEGRARAFLEQSILQYKEGALLASSHAYGRALSYMEMRGMLLPYFLGIAIYLCKRCGVNYSDWYSYMQKEE